MLGAVAALAAPLSFAAAQEPEPRLELTWNAPPECPTRERVLSEAHAMLRESKSIAPPVSVRAMVKRAGGSFHVDLSLDSAGGTGRRAFDADSCAELASAVALIAALAVDPTSRPLERDAGSSASAMGPSADGTPDAAPLVSGTNKDAGTPTEATRQPISAPPTPEPTASTAKVRVAGGAAVAFDVGSLPSVAAGGEAFMAVLRGRARAEVLGTLLLDQHAGDPLRAGQGTALSFARLGGRACYAAFATDDDASRVGLSLAPCVGLHAVRMQGVGYGAAPRSGDALYAAADVGVLATFALTQWLAVRLDIDGLLPLSRPTFVILAPDGSVQNTVFRPVAISGRAAAGIELRFF